MPTCVQDAHTDGMLKYTDLPPVYTRRETVPSDTTSDRDARAAEYLCKPPGSGTRLLLGRRLQCDHAVEFIPSVVFPQVQAHLQRVVDGTDTALRLHTLRKWDAAVYISTNGGIEALLEMDSTNAGFGHAYVDIVVWTCIPADGHLGGCKHVLDELIRLCEKQQDEERYGHVALQRFVLRCSTVVSGDDEHTVALRDRDAALSEAQANAEVASL